MNYGYARCSTNESRQDIDRQVRELKAAGAEEIFLEYEHGDAAVKKQQQTLFDTAQEGDTIITLEVPRLARSTKQLCEIIEIINAKHLTAEFPEPVVKAFLGNPTPPAKLPFCQSTVAAFLNKHSPCLRPIVVPHCQYICHLIASLPPSRKTHRAFFKFWDIISHPWVRCHAGGYCALTLKRGAYAPRFVFIYSC